MKEWPFLCDVKQRGAENFNSLMTWWNWDAIMIKSLLNLHTLKVLLPIIYSSYLNITLVFFYKLYSSEFIRLILELLYPRTWNWPMQMILGCFDYPLGELNYILVRPMGFLITYQTFSLPSTPWFHQTTFDQEHLPYFATSGPIITLLKSFF